MKRFISVLLAAALLLCSLTACSSKDEAKLTSKELADVINANGNDMTENNPAVALDSDDENLSNLFTWYEWDKAKFETGAFSFSLMNVQAYTIAVVKPAEGQKDAVLKYFADYQKQMETNFDKYLIDPVRHCKGCHYGRGKRLYRLRHGRERRRHRREHQGKAQIILFNGLTCLCCRDIM